MLRTSIALYARIRGHRRTLSWCADGCPVLLLLCRRYAALPLHLGPPHKAFRTSFRCLHGTLPHGSSWRSCTHSSSVHAPALHLHWCTQLTALVMPTGPRHSPMDNQPPISTKSSSPGGQESTLLSFLISEESHGHSSSPPSTVTAPIRPLKAPPPPRAPAFIQSLPTANVLAEIPGASDISSSSLPPSLPPPPLPPPSPLASPASMQQSSLLSRGAAGGIAVLVILAIVALAGGLVWYKRRRVRAVEVDPEEALFGACEDPRSPTFRLSTVGSVKGE